MRNTVCCWPSHRFAAVGAYILLYSLFASLAIHCSISQMHLIVGSAIVGALTAIYFVYAFSDSVLHWKSVSGLGLLGAGIDVLTNFCAKEMARPDSGMEAGLIGIGNVGILTAAVCFGFLLSRGIRHTSYLVLGALVGAVADTVSVFAGPTAAIVKTQAVHYLALQWGLIGSGEHAPHILPIVGIGDFVFLSLFFCGARRLGWNAKRTLAAMTIAFVVGILSVLVRPAGLPALPFMTVGLMVGHWHDLHLTQQDWKTIIKLTVLFTLCLLLIVLKRKFM